MRHLSRQTVRSIYRASILLLILIGVVALVATAVWVRDIRAELVNTVQVNLVSADVTSTEAPIDDGNWITTATAILRTVWISLALVGIGGSVGLIALYARLQRSSVRGDWRPRIFIRLSHIAAMGYVVVDQATRASFPVVWWRFTLGWVALVLLLPTVRWLHHLDRQALPERRGQSAGTPD